VCQSQEKPWEIEFGNGQNDLKKIGVCPLQITLAPDKSDSGKIKFKKGDTITWNGRVLAPFARDYPRGFPALLWVHVHFQTI